MNLQNFSKPEAVCFDLDNTLYAYEPCNTAGMEAVYSKLKKLFNISVPDAMQCFEKARAEVKQLLGNTASSHSRLLYFQRMLELLGLHSQPFITLDLEQTFWRNYLQQMELYDGVKDFFYLLRAKNISIAIVSDLTAQIQFRKLIYLELDGLIDYIITSEETGADKPDRKIFQLAIQKLGKSSEKIWMIGDDPAKDIKGAEQCGMRGILLSDKSNSTYTVRNFAELILFFQ